MKRKKSHKAAAITPLPTRKDEHVDHAPLGEPTETTADPALAKATQEVVDEKLAQEKTKKEAEAAAPKARRVGPLRKIHMAALERAAALAQPLLEQIADMRRRVGAINSQAIDDVLEDLGQPKRETGEDARVVEVEGEIYVELARAPTGPAVAPRGTRRRG